MDNKVKRGRFIVFEGIDGAGKTTQIERLAARLRAEGRRVLVTAEPTVSVSGGLLRDALGGLQKRTACEMAAMFVLDRIFHNVSPGGIEETLAAGHDVISDRYYYSSMAYQGSQTDAAWVRDMNLNCPEIRKPDVCIFLDLTPAQSMARIEGGRVTKEIYETDEKLTRVRNQFYRVFEELKGRDRIEIVDASRSIEEIHGEIVGLIRTLN